MLHGEYGRLHAALAAGLHAIGLDRTIDVDGPNRLGGFRLSDGVNTVALSFAPPRRKEDREAGRHWWVSAWVPVDDGYDKLLTADLLPVPHRREVMLRKPHDVTGAVVVALQLLIELRVRGALTRLADMVAMPMPDPHEIPPFPAPAATPDLGDTVFGTALNRAETPDATASR